MGEGQYGAKSYSGQDASIVVLCFLFGLFVCPLAVQVYSW